MNTDINWQALAEPFNPQEVSFRVQSTYERNGKTSAVVVAYIDARNVADRLDAVCGPDGWAFDWQPVVVGQREVLAAKGTLTIAGISKSDVGDAGTTEPTKASVSDALKRAAVLWGIGRYLYDLPFMTATPEQRGKSWILPRAEEERLRREHLAAKPNGQNAPHATPRDNPAAQTKHAPPTPQTTPAASQTQPQPAAVDSMALTYASPIDQKKLSGQLAARWAAVDAQSGFLRNVTGRAIDADKLRDGRSDITLRELAIISQRLASMPANGKAATRG